MEETTLVNRLATCLQTQQHRLICVESCTGGLIAKLCTDVAGSSQWFDHGIVCYSNRAKQLLLDIPSAMIAQHGAVSRAVVEAMVQGARQRAPQSCVIATSGIAGPEGGDSRHPVGLVWFGWHNGRTMRSTCHNFDGNRRAIRQQAAKQALQSLLDALS